MGPVVSVRGQCFNRFDITAQFVGDDDPWFAKPCNQSLENPLGSFGIPAGLYKNIENVSIRVDRTPQPMFLVTDRDHNFVHVPLVVRQRTIPSNAICEVSAKAIDPQPDRFPADNHTPSCQQVFNICRAICEAMVRVLSDQCEPVSAGTIWLSLIPRQVDATQRERRCG